MTTSIQAITQAQTPIEEREINGPCNLPRIVALLLERSVDRLTKSELEWFEYSTELAINQVANIQDIMTGIGCLVGSDTHAGNFQSSHDVPTLLFHFAESLDHVATMLNVGDLASHELRKRFSNVQAAVPE